METKKDIIAKAEEISALLEMMEISEGDQITCNEAVAIKWISETTLEAIWNAYNYGYMKGLGR